MKGCSIFAVLALLVPVLCGAQAPVAPPPVEAKVQVKPAPVDCKTGQAWSQAEERCVNIVTCEKGKGPWNLRCLVNGGYRTVSLQGLYRQGYRLTEITGKGAYFFRDGR